MKPLIALAALLTGAAVAAGGVAYILADGGPVTDASGEEQALRPAPVPVASPGEGSELAELREEVQRLGSTVRQLQMEVEGLRSVASREPLEVAQQAAEQPVPLSGLAHDQLAASVRLVLDEERRREEEAAELERLEREKQNAIRTAERIGERLALAPSDQNLLANHLVNAQIKRNDLMQQMRDSGFDREAMRSSFDQLRDWNSAELNRLFGPDVGAQIAEQTGNMGGRGGFFGGGPGGGRGGRGGGGEGGGGG